MSSAQGDKIINFYKTLASIPTLNSAKLLWFKNSQFFVQSSWTQRNLERSINQKFIIDYVLSNDLQVIAENFPVDITSESLSKISTKNEYKAILRSVQGKDSSNKQCIEIWSKNCLIKNYDLSALDVHGDVYFDGEFGSFSWSSESTKLLYIAEKKLEKSEPFYKQKSLDKKNDDKNVKGNEYIFKPDWGEQMVGKHRPTICVLDINSNIISALPEMSNDLSPGQVIWTPNNDGIVGVAWKHEPRYLGLIYCTNRESWIFLLKNENMQKLSSDGCCVRSPRFSPDGKHLVWLERDLSGPHHNCHRLMHLNWENRTEKVDILIDIVRQNKAIKNDKLFYGLYNHDLPRRCWSTDSRFLFFSTQQHSNIRSYIFDLKTKALLEIANDSSSLNILDVQNDIILFTKTSLLQPPNLCVGRFNGNIPDYIILNTISSTNQAIDLNENYMYEVNEYSYCNDEKIRNFNYIYYGPKHGDDKTCPLIVTPHGGPHSSYVNTFSLESALLVLLGFSIVQVNYRGSTGMGSDNLEYLQGRVGNIDVIDCVTATHEALKKYHWLDPKKIGLSGGSHGGFLVAHLSAQYNKIYRVVVSRNPVIDIAVMFTISDIPDWCAAAINTPYYEKFDSGTQSNNEEILLKMFKCSPIVHVNNVIAPTLLCIGKNDLRVPPSQGKQWYHRLKANGVLTKMLIYDDCHPLNNVPVEMDAIINAALWFCEHFKINN
ncbi:acylamino-acid-releasing enzyme-like isoform X2 [Chelonus insularis]|uniref:acylamino-acid-releasing enzyme-like isoform X2 n=1 Tax=Chelonus insularis TaxID=460826 RepID=UPI00158C9C7A|nr:acylamino-acid-releasing enzyme-like isoform X2 [Chelonus insularis]